MSDPLPGSGLKIGEALLSPTRTYAPVLKEVWESYRDQVAAFFHNTGGGQTKCLRFGQGLTYIKDQLFELPPLFELLAKTGRLEAREMYRSLNMGHRMEVVCEPSAVPKVLAIAAKFEIGAQVVGRTEVGPKENRLLLSAQGETFEYVL
jgi:phosphoribosylformylglycinamidine cyclo-ligase